VPALGPRPTIAAAASRYVDELRGGYFIWHCA
jgi:hypothetical protein